MNKRVSELEAEHRALGAGLDDWNDMDVAWSYATSAEKEHDAVREAAGLFDVSGLKKIWIKGPDALAVVDKISTRDMSKIYEGKSAYCPVLTDEGTICDDTIIFHISDNKYLFVHGAGKSAKRLAIAAEGKDVEIQHDDELHNISLQGPKALPFLNQHCAVSLDDLEYFHQIETDLFGRKVILSRTGYSGERGYEIFTDRKDVVHLWRSILEAGEKDGIMACSFDCLDKIRVEAGLLFYPYDITEAVTPWEVGLDWTISRKKADFMGREALFAKENQQKIKLGGISSSEIDEAMDGEAKLYLDGKEVGAVTSPVYSHRLKKSIALAHIRPDIADGTVLQLKGAEQSMDVTVEAVPFIDTSSARA